MDESAFASLRHDAELWSLFTREEEYEPIFLDRLGRFPAFASRQRTIVDPVVSRFLLGHGLQPSYPENRPYAICLTHDIDALHLNRFRKPGGGAWGRVQRWAARVTDRAITRTLRRVDPGWNMLRIAELEAGFGATSTFFCLALEEGDEDFGFRVSEVGSQLRDFARRGWEVGLHGGHEAFRDLSALEREKDRLEQALGKPVAGYRNHFLRFQVPETWSLLARAGFRYDTTVGYADCVGFRNGVCHPFQPIDRRTDATVPIVEIPLAVMDTTLQLYMRLDPSDAWRVVQGLLKTVEECRGVLTILWHPQNMGGVWGKLYRRILEHGEAAGAWLTGAGDLAEWWLSRRPGHETGRGNHGSG